MIVPGMHIIAEMLVMSVDLRTVKPDPEWLPLKL